MTRKRSYGVGVVRGPVVDLPPADGDAALETLDDLDSLLACGVEGPTAADLFCGAGGLSLGLHDAGFNVVLGVDHDETAVQTHRATFGGLSLVGDLGDPGLVREIAGLLSRRQLDLLAGGPPCQPFSRAGRSKIRSLVDLGARPAYDDRRDLWEAFVEIVGEATPKAVLIENVPDMALGDDMLVLRRIRRELEDMGYAVQARLIDAWRYGVPQHRQRLMVVATAAGRPFTWPDPSDDRITVDQAISDMPDVEGGYRHPEGQDGFHQYRNMEPTPFQRRARSWKPGGPGEQTDRLHDHITRPVRDDDRRAFEFMDSRTTYAELPEDVKRYRDDIFVDKYKRLGGDELSRTITAHIARDGYWYIHPHQPRTLTVREAARIQTFPDRFRFAGPPSSAFRQIGNAVPPELARRIGVRIRDALRQSPLRGWEPSRDIGEPLIDWWTERADAGELARPWLFEAKAVTSTAVGEALLDRVSVDVANASWRELEDLGQGSSWQEAAPLVERVAQVAGRTDRLPNVEALIDRLGQGPEPETRSELEKLPGLAAAMAANVALAVLNADPIVPSAPTVRAAGRILGRDLRSSRMSHGRMAIAEIVGGGENASAVHLALNEVGLLLCRPQNPECDACPLQTDCCYASAD